MVELLLAAILGGIGGSVRGVVGLRKAMLEGRPLSAGHIVVTILIAVMIGIFTGLVVNVDVRVTLLAGYAGTDLLENLIKVIEVRPVK